MSTLTTAHGIARNLAAKRLVQKVVYSPETIAITAFYGHTANGEGVIKPTALPMARPYEQVDSLEQNEFATRNIAPDNTLTQTFVIILPNFIHKSKQRNLS